MIDKKYYIYVIEFCDFTVKVGVTNRPNKRIKEIIKYKKNKDLSSVINCKLLECKSKSNAFKSEANVCRLLSSLSPFPSREWFISIKNNESIFDYVQQVAGMFIGMNSHD